MTKNYCVTGIAGSGKDTAGEYIAEVLGKETYALAYPIKQLVSTLLSTSIDYLDDRSNKEKAAFYSVTVESLQEASVVYNNLGLGEYQDFHDAWEFWIDLLALKLTPWGTYETWLAPRHFFQLIGTEWGRGLYEDLWVSMVPEGAVVTDVRMDNEATYLIGKGYLMLEIKRPTHGKIDSSEHLSEQGVNKSIPRLQILNGGSIEQLYSTLDNVMK